MVKSALKNKEIDKREKLTDAEEQQILTTLIKQRKESVESFTKGGRPELAEKEQAEIGMIEGYLPQAAGEDVIRAVVLGAIDTLTKDGARAWAEGYGDGDEGGAAEDSGGWVAGGWEAGERDCEGGAGEVNASELEERLSKALSTDWVCIDPGELEGCSLCCSSSREDIGTIATKTSGSPGGRQPKRRGQHNWSCRHEMKRGV